MNLEEKLIAAGSVVCYQCPAEALSSFKSGGRVRAVVYPTSFTGTVSTIKILEGADVPFYVLGMGSNVLISDRGYDGFVVCLRKLTGMMVNQNLIYAYAGERLSKLALRAKDESLSGLECLSGIPGSVGGGIFMNCGAYGGEIADTVVYADVLRGDEIVRVYREQMGFSYRSSVFQKNDDIILGAQFELRRAPSEAIAARMWELAAKRRSAHPTEPSLGSVFKRYEGNPVPKLIEGAGLKGARAGGAEVSEKHCGFIVNKGGATSFDYLELVDLIETKVYNTYQIQLQREVRLLGDFDRKPEQNPRDHG